MPRNARSAPLLATGLLALATFPATVPTLALASDDMVGSSAKEIVTETCMECHGGSAMGDDRIAPPMFAAKNHYQNLTDKQDFIATMSAYIQEPSEATTRMPGAIKKFGLMPNLDLDKATADAIAAFVWEADFNEPEWYQQHYQEEHGKAPDQ